MHKQPSRLTPEPPDLELTSIVDFYRLGAYVKRQYRRQLSENASARGNVRGIALELAEHYQIPRTMVDHARRFAEKLTLADARELSQLRSKNSSYRLNRRHIVTLLALKPRQLKSLATKCCRMEWSAGRLELELKKLRPARRTTGRRPRGYNSSRDLVLNLMDHSQRWLRRYDTLIGEAEEDPLIGFSSLKRPLANARRHFAQFVEQAKTELYR